MEFNLTRFSNLIRRDIITYKKPALYAMASTFGFLILVYFFHRISNGSWNVAGNFWKKVYLAFVFSLGLTFTSLVFREFKTPGGRLQFLTLPASNLEKLASRWLYSLIVFPLFITFAVWIMSIFTVPEGDSMFSHFDGDIGRYILLGFVILHALMFLYAIWFNNLVAIKGTLVGLITILILAFLLVGMFWIIFNEYFDGPFADGPNEAYMDLAGQQFFMNKVQPVGEFLIKFFVAPFLWVVSYFKMKEKEA